MAIPTVTGHGEPPPTLIISPLSRCRLTWWHGDWRLRFGTKIGVWVWCGDRRWGMAIGVGLVVVAWRSTMAVGAWGVVIDD